MKKEYKNAVLFIGIAGLLILTSALAATAWPDLDCTGYTFGPLYYQVSVGDPRISFNLPFVEGNVNMAFMQGRCISGAEARCLLACGMNQRIYSGSLPTCNYAIFTYGGMEVPNNGYLPGKTCCMCGPKPTPLPPPQNPPGGE